MNIVSSSGWPSSALSNFAGHRFIIDNVECYSMEGFLQACKFSNPDMQIEVAKLIGKAAKFKGKPKKWYRDQTLYWKGIPMKRNSDIYQRLLDRAYQAMYDQSESFRKALHATSRQLTHSIGRTKISETVLTTKEFCGRLMKLRDSEDHKL
jgi:hypothetical protein